MVLMNVRDHREFHWSLRDGFDLVHELVVVGFAEVLGVYNDEAITSHANGCITAESRDHIKAGLVGHGFNRRCTASCSTTASSLTASTPSTSARSSALSCGRALS